MPTPRKSAATLALRGAFNKDPRRVRDDVRGSGLIGRWLPGSSDPKEVWEELIKAAPAGILTGSDRPALEMVARTIAQVRSDGKALSMTQLAQLVQTLGRFGLSPAGRQALDAPPPPSRRSTKGSILAFLGRGPAA